MTKRPAMWLLVATAMIVVVLAGRFGWDISLGGAGDATTPTPTAVIILDALMPIFLQFEGVYYLRADPMHGRPVTEQDLGAELGRVRSRVSNDAGMIDSPRDGDATVLEAGTPLYAVMGYAISFRIAAMLEEQGRIWLYEAARSPAAVSNADMLDVAGKVVAIDVYDRVDHTTLLATVCDVGSVERLMGAILATPLQGNAGAGPAWQYYLVIQLEDGTASGRALAPASDVPGNTWSNAIAVSTAVVEELEQVMARATESRTSPSASPSTATAVDCAPAH